MTTITITGLPLQSTVQDATLIPVETASVTGHIAASSLKTYISSSTLSSVNAVTGTFTGALTGTTLGLSGAITADSLTTTNDVTVGGSLNINPASTLTVGTLNATNLTGSNIAVTGFILPSIANATAALGSATNWINNLYAVSSTVGTQTVTALTVTGSFTVGNETIGNISTAGNVLANIGSSTNWFNHLYANVNHSLSAYVSTGGLQTTSNIISNIGSSALWFNSLYSKTIVADGITVNTGKLLPGANAVVDIGSTTGWFNNIYGVASHALYADLAEKYQSDLEYPAGTVVVFGEETEITISTQSNDSRVAGVVSTDPAYLMNGGLENGLAVALQGRVPCQVVGPVRRGDLMVTSHIPGVAMSSDSPRIGSVIGKALGNYNADGVGTIEVVVGRI